MEFEADFNEFRKKVEVIFGNIGDMAENYPDMYSHMVLSHGFIEYSIATRKSEKVKEKIKKVVKDFSFDNPLHHNLYNSNLKLEYLTWARENKLEESLLESGWTEFLND